jgi:formylglycine-generating enzyme required for sulfatase activity/energy-coupling factor transporter ATP-binding protein EcfA2
MKKMKKLFQIVYSAVYHDIVHYRRGPKSQKNNPSVFSVCSVGSIFLAGFFIFPTVLFAQNQSNFKWTDIIPWILTFAALVFAFYQYVKRRKDIKLKRMAELEAEKEFKSKEHIREARTAEAIYCAALKEELGTIDMLGSPDIESKTVNLEDAFVSLHISESWRSDTRFETKEKQIDHDEERHLTPEQVMKRAFQKYRVLLIIGDPGSGKTTLLKYYAVHCLDKENRKYQKLGFPQEVLPIFFPLRELEYKNKKNEPVPLHRNLAKWSAKHLMDIPAEQFYTWFQKRETLVLLDGLDEISSKKHRQKVCQWIKSMCSGLKNARFVVTSRATGYRKLDGIELEMPHLRADIMDFSLQQQEDFLKKWFRAVCLFQLPPKDVSEQEWREKQEKQADQRSQTIIKFLKRKENKAVQELAAVPMLLQIMAILWKDKEFFPRTRSALYDAALNYLLEYRDRQKEIEQVLPADEARRVLAPTALWMHEELKRDEAPKEKMHGFMQPILNTLEGQPDALTFCENLRDRAGLIADCFPNHYIFRHKSFREFLSGIQLREDSYQSERVETLIDHFKEAWWDEALRFFMSKSNDKIFDQFMRLFFQSSVSEQLDDNQQTLLQHLVREAPQKKIDALKESLNSDQLNNNQGRYVMDCLKTIGTPEAIEAIENANKDKWNQESRSYADDIAAEASVRVKNERVIEKPGPKELFLEASFRNSFEDNVEYIKIPGGTYKFSVTKKIETVPDLFFCKYPVTNKRYRRFISFLGGKERELKKYLPLDMFVEKLLQYADSIKGYRDYLGKNPKKWQDKLRSEYDDERKFNGDDQPVVGVTWYAARAYCFWLSCLEALLNMGEKLESIDVYRLASIYRLPTEKEWEWAAGGEPDGTVREYPWSKNTGKPDSSLANYDGNAGATTPVGRYPEGATPKGLMDMAGNAWEWMGNYSSESKKYFALRGGSWYNYDCALRCAARLYYHPDDRLNRFGFRVLRSQS